MKSMRHTEVLIIGHSNYSQGRWRRHCEISKFDLYFDDVKLFLGTRYAESEMSSRQ